MKTLAESIINELRISNVSTGARIKYHPKTKEELEKCIKKEIRIQGLNADLNCIDTSKITDMSELFNGSEFNGDVSRWDVSNVTNMTCMFANSEFDGDLSNWDVSNVKSMYTMFGYSRFTGKNGDISVWDVRNVENMGWMFELTKFDCDLSKWEVNSLKYTGTDIFKSTPLEKNPPKWCKEEYR